MFKLVLRSIDSSRRVSTIIAFNLPLRLFTPPIHSEGVQTADKEEFRLVGIKLDERVMLEFEAEADKV